MTKDSSKLNQTDAPQPSICKHGCEGAKFTKAGKQNNSKTHEHLWRCSICNTRSQHNQYHTREEFNDALKIGAARRKPPKVNITNPAGTPGRQLDLKIVDEPDEIETPPGEKNTTAKTTIEEDGNTAVLSTILKGNPRGLEDLIRECKIDTKIWEVERWVSNTWDTTMKVKRGVNNVEVITSPNFQIKAWLIRKTPIKHEWPIISPVVVNLPKIQKVPALTRTHKKVLVLGDSQVGFYRNIETGVYNPFHDRGAMDVALQVAQQERPDIIVLLGDMLDVTEWTDKFIRSPECFNVTQPALMELSIWIAKLRATGAEIIYIEGNHEMRLETSVITNLPAAYKLHPVNVPTGGPPALSVKSLLDLEARDVKYLGPYPTGEYWLNDMFKLHHGEVVRAGSSKTVEAVVKDAVVNEGFGHVHRLESAHKNIQTRYGEIVIGAYSFGTLARTDGAVPGKSPRVNWQKGLGLINFTSDPPLNETPQLHAINPDASMINGRIYIPNVDLVELSETIKYDMALGRNG